MCRGVRSASYDQVILDRILHIWNIMPRDSLCFVWILGKCFVVVVYIGNPTWLDKSHKFKATFCGLWFQYQCRDLHIIYLLLSFSVFDVLMYFVSMRAHLVGEPPSLSAFWSGFPAVFLFVISMIASSSLGLLFLVFWTETVTLKL